MTIVTVPMYRVECSHEGCGADAQEGSDYCAWTDPGVAVDEAVQSDWYVVGDKHLCPEHAPLCAEPDCGVPLRDDQWGVRCEDHAPEPTP